MDEKMVIPDSIEPVEGWKALEWNELFGVFRSPMTGVFWPPKNKLVATCGQGHPHKAPNEACRCGIYMVTDPYDALGYGRSVPVLVKVKGWGKVVPGQRGWRVQYALPVEAHILFPGDFTEDVCKHITEIYGIPAKRMKLREIETVTRASARNGMSLIHAVAVTACLAAGAVNFAIGAIEASPLSYATGLFSMLVGGALTRRYLRRMKRDKA